MPRPEKTNKIDSFSAAILAALSALLFFVWYQILFSGPAAEPKLFFLDVGQGDSALIELPGGAQILFDAGPSRKVLDGLENVLGSGDRYIDLAVISHPELDHYNGFNYLLGHYRFGAFIFNGRMSESEEWKLLMSKIKESGAPLIALGSGDKISYGEDSLEIISPNSALAQSAEFNDTSLVSILKAAPFTALFAGDIGANVEKYLAERFNLHVDILKVPHHGSKYSSSDILLGAAEPKLAIVEVGAGNTYGHPTEAALSRIAAYTKNILRTDENGTVEIRADGRELLVFTER